MIKLMIVGLVITLLVMAGVALKTNNYEDGITHLGMAFVGMFTLSRG